MGLSSIVRNLMPNFARMAKSSVKLFSAYASALSLAVAPVACGSEEQEMRRGCVSDSDCKGERVCVAGSCTYPVNEEVPPRYEEGKERAGDREEENEIRGECILGETIDFYAGPRETQNRGECKAGIKECKNIGGQTRYITTIEEVLPTVEICGNNDDENCNGIDDCSSLVGKFAFADKEDGNVGIVGSGNWDIYVISATGYDFKRLTDNPLDDENPSWFPDMRLAFLRKPVNFVYPSEILIMDVSGANQRKILDDGLYPAVSRDGAKIAFTKGGDLFVTNSDGGNQQKISDDDLIYVSGSLSWSPDGTKIVFAAGREEEREIYTISLNGGNLEQLTDNENFDSEPVWSPNGRKIAFVREEEQEERVMRVYVINPDGTNQINISDRAVWPTWSPDSTKIAFCSRESIYIKGLDDENFLVRILVNYCRDLSWSSR